MKQNITIPSIVISSLIGALLLIVVIFALTTPLWQWSWTNHIPAVGNVRTEPTWPILKMQNVSPGSAFDLLRKATDLESKISKTDSFDAEVKTLNLIPWTGERYVSLLRVLNQSGEAMKLIERATTVGTSQMPTYSSPLDSMPYLMPFMQIEKLFFASAARKVAAGDVTGGYSDLNVSLDAASILSHGSCLLPRLVEVGSEVSALRAMRLLALENNIPSSVATETIQHLVHLDTGMEPFAEVYRQEFRCGLETMVGMFFDPQGPNLIGIGNERSLHWGAHYLGFLVGSSQTETLSHLKRVYAWIIHVTEQPYDAKQQQEWRIFLSRPLDETGWRTIHDPFGYFLAKEIVPGFITASIKYNIKIADLRATEVVLAVRQFLVDNKRAPKNLEELAPAYLPAVPLDPFDGKPLRYKIVAEGGWCVYSVGPNQKDDDGTPTPTHSPSYDTPGDLVYPSREVDDEKTRLLLK